MKNILRIDSSARHDTSLTRKATSAIVQWLQNPSENHQIVERNVATGLSFINEQWVGATFTPVEQRTSEQRQALSDSDVLVEELQAADHIVIGVPMYNFSIPASLKAWLDMVARAGVTFKYTENGPVGLLSNKKVIVALASGGVTLGSAMDFASGYLKHVLGFLGLNDVTFVSANEGSVVKNNVLNTVVIS